MPSSQTPQGDEAAQFILHCKCGRFKARCKTTYSSWRQELLDELMLRVWQHVEALPDNVQHQGVAWDHIEACHLQC